jgi:hypothetical protein
MNHVNIGIVPDDSGVGGRRQNMNPQPGIPFLQQPEEAGADHHVAKPVIAEQKHRTRQGQIHRIQRFRLKKQPKQAKKQFLRGLLQPLQGFRDEPAYGSTIILAVWVPSGP